MMIKQNKNISFFRVCTLTVPIVFGLIVAMAHGYPQSGCEICAQTNQCSQAFHGGMGKYCGRLANTLPCCCPTYSECKVTFSTSSCMCHIPNDPNTYSNYRHGSYSNNGIESVFAMMIPVMICCLCANACCRCYRNNPNQYISIDESVPVVPAVAVPYGSTSANPPPTAPSYIPSMQRSSIGPIGAALGGFGTGFLAGEFLGSRRGRERGYDIAGDTGGNDIAGDF